MRIAFDRSTTLLRSPRAVQVEGMFGIDPAESITRSWEVELPDLEAGWTIGLIVGPSGSGKTSILEEAFDYEPHATVWPLRSAVVDGFEDELDTDEIVRTLTGVGFSSPPAWLRPYRTLSTGEQFRVDLARSILYSRLRSAWGLDGAVAVVDEFTSTVDRTVAHAASVAVARLLRGNGGRLVAASCHYDIIDWLQPEWVLDTGTGILAWRSLHPRPAINLDIRPAERHEWAPFAPHHYLNTDLAKGARCFLGAVDGRPATFVATLPTPSPHGYSVQREHRCVCLPDFQGLGLGHAAADTVAAGFRARGWRYRSTTSHPAMIGRRARSAAWDMVRSPSFEHSAPKDGSRLGLSSGRRTATFEYVGPVNAAAADVLAIPQFTRRNA